MFYHIYTYSPNIFIGLDIFATKNQVMHSNISSHIYLLLTLSAHAREGYSSHFVCHSVSLSLFDFGEDAVFQG